MRKPKPADDPKTCASCAFFTPERVGDSVGECRRYPPTPIVINDQGACICPQMEVNDWCGEYLRRTH